jgi:ribosomal protein S24E
MITVTDKKDNHLVGRVEMKAHMKYNGATPSNVTVRKEVAQEFKADEKLVVVKHIYTSFGKQEAEISAFIYKNVKIRDEFEPKLKAAQTKVADEAKKKTEEKKKAEPEASKDEVKVEPTKKKEEPRAEEKKAAKEIASTSEKKAAEKKEASAEEKPAEVKAEA